MRLATKLPEVHPRIGQWALAVDCTHGQRRRGKSI
jgi:hypothetical protein